MARDNTSVITICIVLRSSPYGSIRVQEGLEAVLMASAFEQRLIVVLMDDAVVSLRTGQQPRAIGAKDFSRVFRALEMYGVEQVLVDAESLREHAMNAEPLLVDAAVLGSREIATVLDDADVVMSF